MNTEARHGAVRCGDASHGQPDPASRREICPISYLAQPSEPHHERHLKQWCSSSCVLATSRACMRGGWQRSTIALQSWRLQAKRREPTLGCRRGSRRKAGREPQATAQRSLSKENDSDCPGGLRICRQRSSFRDSLTSKSTFPSPNDACEQVCRIRSHHNAVRLGIRLFRCCWKRANLANRSWAMADCAVKSSAPGSGTDLTPRPPPRAAG